MSLVDHIPHRRQLSNWDCGLACVSMVLASLHHPHTLLGLRGSNAVRDGVWTIDLAYLLRKYGIDDFTYYTSYIGVNQQYNRTQFYSATISHDRSRVHSLFAGAHDNNVRVVAWTLPIDDMIRFLDSNRYAIIILVDLNLLHCRNCKKARARKSKSSAASFVGHYILLVGYDPDSDRFTYRDPGTDHEMCTVDADALHEARRAPGTDCDVIVVRVR
ncbi:Guanylyl cyclase [Powellomyces hirtus]|nr:Guanylyl cyclase [Powellomyces hirtus]